MNNQFYPPAAACRKPRKMVVPLPVARGWRGGGGFLYQEKMDGCFALLELDGDTIAGERMPDGRFVAFDLLARHGQDIAGQPLVVRWRELLGWFQDVKNRALPAAPGFKSSKIELVPTGNGGEFLEHVLARGGEGIVAKDLAAPYGDMLAAKRVQVFYCRVIATDACTGGVWLADRDTAEPRGKMPLRGNKFEQVRVGSVLKVEAFGLTAKGLLREARPDKDRPDSWLVQF